MGLLKSLISAVAGGGNSAASTEAASLLPALIEYINTYPGGLAGLIRKLQANGLGDVITSWIGSGANQPVSTEQLESALGSGTVKLLAQNAGQEPNAVLTGLTSLLPQLIDHMSPDGVVQTQELDAATLMGSVSGLLRKL